MTSAILEGSNHALKRCILLAISAMVFLANVSAAQQVCRDETTDRLSWLPRGMTEAEAARLRPSDIPAPPPKNYLGVGAQQGRQMFLLHCYALVVPDEEWRELYWDEYRIATELAQRPPEDDKQSTDLAFKRHYYFLLSIGHLGFGAYGKTRYEFIRGDDDHHELIHGPRLGSNCRSNCDGLRGKWLSGRGGRDTNSYGPSDLSRFHIRQKMLAGAKTNAELIADEYFDNYFVPYLDPDTQEVIRQAEIRGLSLTDAITRHVNEFYGDAPADERQRLAARITKSAAAASTIKDRIVAFESVVLDMSVLDALVENPALHPANRAHLRSARGSDVPLLLAYWNAICRPMVPKDVAGYYCSLRNFEDWWFNVDYEVRLLILAGQKKLKWLLGETGPFSEDEYWQLLVATCNGETRRLCGISVVAAESEWRRYIGNRSEIFQTLMGQGRLFP